MTRLPSPVRVARWSATHPWRAAAIWLVFVVAAVVAGSLAGTHQSDEAAPGQAGRAQRIIDSGHFADRITENVLISGRSGALPAGSADTAAAEVTTGLRAVSGVTVAAPVTSADGRAVLVRAEMDASGDVGPLLAATAAVQSAHPDLRVEEGGEASLNDGLANTVDKDFARAELFSIPLTLIILLVAFGALIAAAVPLLLALSAVAAAIGLAALASHVMPDTGPTNSVILLIGLAVGVDYSLFYIRREREERARGRDRLDAIEVAAATSGHAVLVSGVAVVVSMAGLYLAGDSTFSSIATGAVLVVIVAVAGSLTVLPAVLAKLGKSIDRLRVPILWRLTARSRTRPPRFWPAILRPVLARPAATLACAVALLLALAIPALGMHLRLTTNADLPRSIPVVQTYDRLVAAFPTSGSTHVVAVRAPAEESDAVRTALASLAAQAAKSPLFASDGDLRIKMSADRRVATMELPIPYGPIDPLAAQSLAVLRNTLAPQALDGIPGASFAVTGETAGNADFVAHVRDVLPLVIGFVLLFTFITLLLTFRSVVIALTAITLNALSAGAAFGILTLTFQHTWAQGLLGFRSSDGVMAWLPLLLFVILFGLSMDYHVFVVSRIREAAMRGVPTRDAVREGLTVSAGVVTSAAAVMVGVFSVFATLSAIDMKQMGVGLAAAILLDATLIRAVVLPAAMTVLGRWNWWTPDWLRQSATPVRLADDRVLVGAEHT